MTPSISKDMIEHLKTWPFEEAKKVLQRVKGNTPKKGYVLFQTGYGPSGLPHIGTFGEVARTSMVMHAFRTISDIPTRLFCFSDDLDGLRKVPGNVPNQDMLKNHLYKALTNVPDPFELYGSFGEHNNKKLCEFLDAFGFEYEFQSATRWYKEGLFDEALLNILNHYQDILDVLLPTLRHERQATYSPFLPICPRTHHVLQVKMEEYRPKDGTVVYKDPDTQDYVEIPVTGGHCKLQWKVDWAMRQMALDVDYEMSGKDLIDSVKVGTAIHHALGNPLPVTYTYEHFLDDQGQKISKSKGNGLSMEEWLRYAPTESLSYYMFHAPRRAKRLFFDVIPKAVDEYLSHINSYPSQDLLQQHDNPVWHIHKGHPPAHETGLSYSMLLNLASVCNADNSAILWGFVGNYNDALSPEKNVFLNQLIEKAVIYYQDFVKPHKKYRAPTSKEKEALMDLYKELEGVREPCAKTYQEAVYSVGKKYEYENLKDWFATLYEVLLGQTQGPRMGTFIALYGAEAMKTLIKEKCA
jgi:lysyl-tRNA synthetase class 1